MSEALAADAAAVLSNVHRVCLGPRTDALQQSAAELTRPEQPCILVTALPSAVPLAVDGAGAAVVALGRCAAGPSQGRVLTTLLPTLTRLLCSSAGTHMGGRWFLATTTSSWGTLGQRRSMATATRC